MSLDYKIWVSSSGSSGGGVDFHDERRQANSCSGTTLVSEISRACRRATTPPTCHLRAVRLDRNLMRVQRIGCVRARWQHPSQLKSRSAHFEPDWPGRYALNSLSPLLYPAKLVPSLSPDPCKTMCWAALTCVSNILSLLNTTLCFRQRNTLG